MTGSVLKRTVENMFSVIKDRSNSEEVTFVCPMPGCGDETGNRSVNLKSGKTNCWRCGEGGDFVRWARRAGFEVTDAGEAAYSPEALAASLNINKETLYAPSSSGLRLPEGFTRCEDDPESVYSELIEDMAIRKNLEWEDMVEAGAGFTRVGKWEPFTLFPTVENRKVVYFQGRTYIDEPDQSTKLFPSRKEAPLGSRYWVYGIDDIYESREKVTAVVMESILNVLSMRKLFRERGVKGMIPVCVFKHSVSKEQLYKLLRSHKVDELCLLFDLDAAENSWSAAPRANDLVRVTVAEMPEVDGNTKLDPNDNPEAAMEAIESRKKLELKSFVNISLSRIVNKEEFDLTKTRF